MPNFGFHFEKIPVPSLRAYSYFSRFGLALALLYCCCLSQESFSLTFTNQVWCTAAALNMCYCTWFLVLAGVKEHIFGPISRQEIENIQDTFWNFVFHKSIFVFGVLNVQDMLNLICWMGWLGVLGSLHILTQLCTDRSNDISIRRRQSGETQVKILLLLLGILACCVTLVYAAISIGYFLGLKYLVLLSAELIIVIFRVLQTIVEQQINVWSLHHPEQVWENKFMYLHYTELVFSLLALSIDFAHHVHMLLWVDMFLSMASLVLLMKLRFLYQEIYQKLEKHRFHWTITHNMQSLQRVEPRREKCTICWDNINPGCMLRCTHVFHTPCLYTWLRDHQTCPVCRENLSYLFGTSFQLENALSLLSSITGVGRGRQSQRRNLFTFAGSTLASWLPNFSVEVLENDVLQSAHVIPARDLHMMVEHVRQVFPNMSTYQILLDLSQTHSMTLTVENIVQGNSFCPDLEESVSSVQEKERLEDTDMDEYKTEIDELERDALTAGSDEGTTETVVREREWPEHTSEREYMLMRRRDRLIGINKRRFLKKYPITS